MNVDEFDARIRTAESPLLVEFWAPWCIPCRVISPILTKMQEKYAGQVDLLRINADESAELLKKLGVLSIPTLIGYREGAVIFCRAGSLPAHEIDGLFASLAGIAPSTRGPSGVARLVRAGAGLALIAAGLWESQSLWLVGLGVLVAFTAVYDRCPVYQALAPRMRNLIKGLFAPQNKSA